MEVFFGDGIAAWGGDIANNTCEITVAGLNLKHFAADYQAALFCGLQRQNVDRLADTVVAKSAMFNIDQRNFDIHAR